MLSRRRTIIGSQKRRRSVFQDLQEEKEVELDRPADTEAADADEPDEDTTAVDASPDTADADTATAELDDEDAEVEEGEESAKATGDPKREHRKRLRIKFVRRAAAAVLAAVLAGAGYEAWLLFEQHQEHVAARQALDAAKKYILTLTSIDPNAVDRNFTEVLDGSTGEFKDMYTRSSAQLRQALIDNKAAAHGNVVDAAVKSATSDKVEVVLFVDQAVSNASSPAPQMDRSRVQMTMEKVDGRWLASKVELP